MKKRKNLGIVLFIATLISPHAALLIASQIGEVNIFSTAGMIRYLWIMWLFIPIGILSIIVGISLKKNNQKYKKNFVIAFICIPLLIIFGSYRFIFNNISYDTNKIVDVENKVRLSLPNDIKIATTRYENYTTSYVKIINDDENKVFQKEIENNQLWKNELSFKMNSLLPLFVQTETSKFDHFLVYNVTKNEYNNYPTDGKYELIFIAYDYDLNRLLILDDYKVNIN